MKKEEEKESKKEEKSKKEDNKKQEISELKKELEKTIKERDEYKELVQRIKADFDNYKKRVEQERKNQILYASEDIIKKFLPILDNLELALKHNERNDEFTKGIELIYSSIIDMLEQEGVKPIIAQDMPFDPYRHEALMSRESEKPENTVIEVMQKGYSLNERIIRPAKVIISKKKIKEENNSENKTKK